MYMYFLSVKLWNFKYIYFNVIFYNRKIEMVKNWCFSSKIGRVQSSVEGRISELDFIKIQLSLGQLFKPSEFSFLINKSEDFFLTELLKKLTNVNSIAEESLWGTNILSIFPHIPQIIPIMITLVKLLDTG